MAVRLSPLEQWVRESRPSGKPVFSRARRVATTCAIFSLFLAVAVSPLLLTVVLMEGLAPDGTGPVAALLALAGFALFILACLRLPERFLLFGNGRLRREVGEKLAAAGAGEAMQTGQWVGLAIGEERCTYDGDTDWDVGFLVLRPDTLVYCGDRAHFALRPEQVTRLALTDPFSPLDPEIRLQLDWHNAESGQSGVLTLVVRQFRTRAEARQKLEGLKARLEAWRQGAPPAAGTPLVFPLPPVSVAGGVPRKARTGNRSPHSQLPRPAAPPQAGPETLPLPHAVGSSPAAEGLPVAHGEAEG